MSELSHKNQNQHQNKTESTASTSTSALPISFSQALNIHFLKYLGVGLLSGSLVHAGTLGGSMAKYIFFIILGVFSIVAGHLLELKAQKISIKLNWIVLAVIIAFGTGMLSGSIQHYFDSPQVASFLFAGGFILTFFGLLLQNYRPLFSWRKIALGVLIALLSYVFLSRVAPSFIPNAFLEGGHHHGAANHGDNHGDNHHDDVKTPASETLGAKESKESKDPSEEAIAQSFESANTADAPILAKEPSNEANDHTGHDHSKHPHP